MATCTPQWRIIRAKIACKYASAYTNNTAKLGTCAPEKMVIAGGSSAGEPPRATIEYDETALLPSSARIQLHRRHESSARALAWVHVPACFFAILGVYAPGYAAMCNPLMSCQP
jgi:hypothetical protein